jgi:hypothetical protein
MTVTQPGTIIAGKVIPAGLVIAADDVTVTGNVIQGATDPSAEEPAVRITGDNVELSYNLIGGTSTTTWSQDPIAGIKLLGANGSISHNELVNIAGDGINLYGPNAAVTGNWVHGFVLRDTGVHYDAVNYPDPGNDQSQPALISDNRIEMWVTGRSSGMNSVVGLPGLAPRIVVHHNLLAGGAFTLQGGSPGTTITDNLFWTEFSDTVGQYGPTAHLSMSGMTWIGNALTTDGILAAASLGY